MCLSLAERRNVVYLRTALQEHFEQTGQDRDAAEVNAARFLHAFAGCTLIVPTPGQLRTIDAEQRIREVLSRDPSLGALRRLSEVLGIPERTITKTYRRVTGVGLEARRRALAVDDRDSVS